MNLSRYCKKPVACHHLFGHVIPITQAVVLAARAVRRLHPLGSVPAPLPPVQQRWREAAAAGARHKQCEAPGLLPQQAAGGW